MKRLGLGIALGLSAVAGIASACWYGNYSSVHFHSGKPDFGLLPRRGILHWKERDVRPLVPDAINGDTAYVELRDEWEGTSSVMEANRLRLLTQAYTVAGSGKWQVGRIQLQAAGKRFGWTPNLRDVEQALTRMIVLPSAQQSTAKPAMKLYLDGMALWEAKQNPAAESKFTAAFKTPYAGFVREHALYQNASLNVQENRYALARSQYRRLLREYPKSPKRENTLIMLVRNSILPHQKDLRDITAGKTAMAQLEKEFPHSRFLKELPGLHARLLYLDNQYRTALNAYLRTHALDSARIVIAALPKSEQEEANIRLLAANLRAITAAKTYKPYEMAIREVNRLRQTATAKQAKMLSSLLLRDPELASDYLYYRLYHTVNNSKQIKQLAHFAEEVADAHPDIRFSPAVMTRFAEAAYREGAYSRALSWANHSLQTLTTDRALYVRGASRHKRKQIAGATHDFETILKRFPKSPLVPNARENLALLYEAVERFDKALDIFFVLKENTQKEMFSELGSAGYEKDVAYLLDVRMTTAQIAAYVRSHPHHWEKNLLIYSLGIRYLRDERWNDAEHQFWLLPRKIYAEYSKGRKEWSQKPSPEPLTVIRDLRLRQRKIGQAKTNNARAKAMYEYASYYSTHGTLLLYNPALWGGNRMLSFDYFWNDHVMTQSDILPIRRYMYSHEAFARSRALCKQIARQYPHAPILPYVLYRQAAATRRLGSFNQWWNAETNRAKLWKESINTMRRIVRLYPKHPVSVHARKYAVVFEKEQKELVWARQNKNGVRTAFAPVP